MLEIVIGNYKSSKGDVIISKFSPDVIYKTDFDNGCRKVIFADEAQITKKLITFIAENATANILVVCNDRSITKGMRKSTKKWKITEAGDFVEEMNPFELTKAILQHSDRNYIFNFLCANKVSPYMIVKIMVSQYSSLCEHNRKIVAFLDMHQWKINPEITFAMMAYKLKTEPYIRYLKWNFPKKQEESDE